MKHLLSGALAVIIMAGVAVAGPYEDGMEAFNGKDYAKAAKMYRAAADKGDARAQYSLGHMYHWGLGMPRNNTKAVGLFRKAAEQGNAPAQFNLGFMYAEGQGVAQDYGAAAKWYGEAAEQGFSRAQWLLGFLYRDGRGVSQDRVQAHMWFSLAAASGSKFARISRDRMAVHMTPAQIAEAQRMARDWKPMSRR